MDPGSEAGMTVRAEMIGEVGNGFRLQGRDDRREAR
jgi:hypothetical protein